MTAMTARESSAPTSSATFRTATAAVRWSMATETGAGRPAGLLSPAGGEADESRCPPTTPGGTVVEADLWGIYRAGKHGLTRLVANARLDGALGKRTHGRITNTFVPADGLAHSLTGAVYADTNSGDGWTNVSALVEVSPDGRVRTLWTS